MGAFGDSPKWKLINDFTIHEDENLTDRPFMRTCVPKRLSVEVTAFEVVHYVEWPSLHSEDKRAEAYTDKSFVMFSGDLGDTIIVFTMDGEVASFCSLTEATIRPLPTGQIGGKCKATSLDGIAYSGMSSRDVPPEGLMVGEPGVITYLGEFEEQRGSGNETPATLTASLFLDEDKFTKLLTMLTLSPRPITIFKLHLLAELFESEMSASLSEPWMSRDYGLLMKGSDLANTSARLESLTLSAGPTSLQTGGEIEESGATLDQVIDSDIHPELYRGSPASMVDSGGALLNYQRLIFIALVALILIALFKG
jgi:hypothetical protein